MKIHHIICLSAVFAIPQLAGAEFPFPTGIFGKLEGSLDFCSKANPKAAEKYEALKKQLLKDVEEKEVSEARKTKDYKAAYESAIGEFAKLPKEKAAKECSAPFEESK